MPILPAQSCHFSPTPLPDTEIYQDRNSIRHRGVQWGGLTLTEGRRQGEYTYVNMLEFDCPAFGAGHSDEPTSAPTEK